MSETHFRRTSLIKEEAAGHLLTNSVIKIALLVGEEKVTRIRLGMKQRVHGFAVE